MAVKISELPSVNVATSDDLLVIVDDTRGSPITKNITVGNFFGNVVTSSVFANTVTVKGILSSNTANSYFSNVHISTMDTPVSSLTIAQAGAIWYDNNFLYVAVSPNNVKRVALSAF